MSDLAAALEPYVLLAKPANGLAAMKIVEQATSAPGVYVFSELLELPNIQALKQDPSSVKAFNLLELFAYGTLQEYTSSPQSYTSLSPAQTTKLRHLTLVSLASQRRILPYADILQALQLDSENELEDLIIDVIYAGLLRGRIHHYEKILHIDWVAGRDIRPEGLLVMQRSVQNWCTTAENLLRALDTQIAYTQETTAQQAHHTTLYNSHRDQIYTEVALAAKTPKLDGRNASSSGHARRGESNVGGSGHGNDGHSRLRSAGSGTAETRSSKRLRDGL